MKILCVIDNVGSGGAQRQLTELALGFKEKGNEVSFLIYNNYPFQNTVLEKAGILIYCIEESNYMLRLLKMRKYIRRGKFDSVLSFLEVPSFICELAGFPYRKWKLVVGERSADPAILKSIKLILFRWFHFFADFIVSNSQSNINFVRRVNPFLAKSKCRVIYNIVDTNLWTPLYDSISIKRDIRLKLVIAANYMPGKNVNGLIEGLKLLNQNELEKILIEWYGNRSIDPYFDQSFLIASKKIKTYGLDNVISLNPLNHNIRKIIQESDAVGLFSLNEGLPNIVCEGMACGKPIICSKVSDIPELLSFDKNLLCDPINPHSIKQAISYLISLSQDQRIKIGNENRRISIVRFEKESILADYLRLLEHEKKK